MIGKYHILFPFFFGKEIEQSNTLPKITEFMSGRAEIWYLTIWFYVCITPPHHNASPQHRVRRAMAFSQVRTHVHVFPFPLLPT